MLLNRNIKYPSYLLFYSFSDIYKNVSCHLNLYAISILPLIWIMNKVLILFSECSISANPLRSRWRCREIEKQKGGKKIHSETGRNCTTLRRIVFPGGYGVYALKAFWYYANAIKRTEGNMARCHSPWSLLEILSEERRCRCRAAPLSAVFHGKRQRIVQAAYETLRSNEYKIVPAYGDCMIVRT